PSKRHYGEHVAIEVVVQVEVAGKAGAGVVGLVPAAAWKLGLDEVAYRPLCGRSRLTRRVQADQRPGRLRGGRRAAPAPRRVAVGTEVLAEPAARVLHAAEPVD